MGGGFYLGFRVWEGSCTSIVKGDLGACPSRKVWILGPPRLILMQC